MLLNILYLFRCYKNPRLVAGTSNSKTLVQSLGHFITVENTVLNREVFEDAILLSGGQIRRLMLARALYKDAPVILFDEPTAALDPVAESQVYSSFNDIVGEKTAVYISHRLSSCRFCSDIAVFHEGELVQRGNHQQLSKNPKGKYYELWNAQAQYYHS